MAFLDENGVSRLWTRVLSKLGSKVDKVDGKGLSTNDYTTEEKNKLAGIENGAQVNQNAIGTITANGDTVFTSSTASDTFKLGAGSNISYALQDDGTLNIGVFDYPTFDNLNISSSSATSYIDFTVQNSSNESYIIAIPSITTLSLGTRVYTEEGYLGGVKLDINGSENGGTLNSALTLTWDTNGSGGETYQVYHSGMTTAIPISQGGTGAITASGARESLGITAENLGITAESLGITAESIGAAPSSHTQSASTIVSGMFPSWVKANTNAMKALSTSQLRNITISTTDLVEGESTLAEGEVYLVYDGGEA